MYYSKVFLLVVLSVINYHVVLTSPDGPEVTEGRDFWMRKGSEELADALNVEINKNFAKNVIVFIGDGMGVTTITTARIYSKGETGFLGWEKFDHIGVLKTYSNNKLVPDSASTATALFCGVKANHKTTGVDGSVQENDCEASLRPDSQTPSIFDWAIEAGKATGFVTTTRVTHATPSALYAHSSNRNWECESMIPTNSSECKDIARQLIEDEPGRNIKVIMGGGRQMFQSNSTPNPNDPIDHWACKSSDGRDLIRDWISDKKDKGASNAYVSNNEQLENLDDSTEFVLGIFANSHLSRDHSRDAGPKGMPSLRNMTEKAIRLLQKHQEGYILMVEGGQIDIAHHRGHARQALHETKALSEAVEGAMSLIDTKDTLVIVTSDHSHSLMFPGYADRGQGVLGLGDISEKKEETAYTSLLYAVGGPNNFQFSVNGNTVVRKNPANNRTDDFEYSQQSGILSKEAVHAGADVLVYATGPMSHLVHSVREQTFVAHLISYATRIGPFKNVKSGTGTFMGKHVNVISFAFVLILINSM